MTGNANPQCPNCNNRLKLFRFAVMVVEKSRTRTVNMNMCAICSRQIIEMIEAASSEKFEVTYAP